ncbi:hypothetical protein [Flavobacterium sp. HNIBRBA15423]|uniref:hypothetical protein n=1 Tax=Flavobacterium sp. HNIBRBA15423 TaxID=3458683 RepID=UPI004043BC68
MSVLQNRSNRAEEILQGRFIQKKMEETSREIQKTQDQTMSSFKSSFWNDRTFSVSNGELTYKHDKRNRFVDMRTRTSKNGTKQPKKARIVHNKIIWGQYNFLVRELAFGYTEAAKNEIKSLEGKQ